MSRYDEVMAKAREMSCSHQHIRTTECIYCNREWEAMARECQEEEDKKNKEGKEVP